MAGLLEGKSALVTGGASGIGRATALAMAREGARVAVADQTEAGAAGTVAMVNAAGGQAIAIGADVAREDQIQAMVARTVSAFGRLDCAFNNAGVFLCMKHEIVQMLAQGGGAIVNTASIAGLVGLPMATNYVAAKHGVVGITKTAAMEYAQDNIRVNCVNPGYIKTPMTDPTMAERYELLMTKVPMNRLGVPEEIAEAVVWMCSDRASFMTGASHIIDGGYYAA
jgi:NAD(P)-dependent dehydrogenase (short-subunit alcohol dehydrogenase family)